MNNISKYIDHTNLKPEANSDDIEKICKEALKYGFASVCVNPCYVKHAYQFLKGSNVNVCTVIGFPLGATTTEVKVFEAENAVNNGAKEIDMVINIGAVKDKNYVYVENEIKQVVNKVKNKAIVKVIIETCLLTEEEKKLVCNCCLNAGADFIKTSTGFNGEGAKLEDIKLIKSIVGDNVKIKASGGIRTLDSALDFIKAGANRIGSSSGTNFVNK